MPYPKLEVVERRLTGYATWYAGSKGFRFGPGAGSAMEQMAMTAAQRTLDEARKAKTPEKAETFVRQAEAAISHFIDTMISARRKIRGYARSHPFEIGEETYGRAERSLCPLWPIC